MAVWSRRSFAVGAALALLSPAAVVAGVRSVLASTPAALTVTTLVDGHLDTGATRCVSSAPPANGGCTLRAAIELVPTLTSGAAIALRSGRFQLTLGELTIRGAMAAINGAGPDQTVVLGDGAHRVFDIADPGARVTMSGLGVSGGSALDGDGLGGGILNLGALTLANAGVKGNVAVTGGGIGDFGSLILGPGTVVSGNAARTTASTQLRTSIGGGIAEFGSLKASGALLAANQSAFSGGNLAVGSSMTADGRTATQGTAKVDSTTIRDGVPGVVEGQVTGENLIAGGGGAFINSCGPVSFTASTFTGNVSGALGAGGAISAGGPLTLINDTLSGNAARSGDAIVFSPGCSASATIIAPSAVQPPSLSKSTGGVASAARTNAPAVASDSLEMDFVTMRNDLGPGGSIVGIGIRARNSILDTCRNDTKITSLGHNLEKGNTCGLNQPGDMVNTDPRLGPLQDNGGPTLTMALAAGTPAVDAADPACGEPVDQRGITRPQGARCDIGAFELQMPPSPLPLPPVTGATGSSSPAAALLAALLVLSLVIAGSLSTLIRRRASGGTRV
jgi:hypothetical protein